MPIRPQPEPRVHLRLRSWGGRTPRRSLVERKAKRDGDEDSPVYAFATASAEQLEAILQEHVTGHGFCAFRIPAENRLTTYRTARSAFPDAGRDHLSSTRNSGESRIEWREYRDGSRRHNPLLYGAGLYDVGARSFERVPWQLQSAPPRPTPLLPHVQMD